MQEQNRLFLEATGGGQNFVIIIVSSKASFFYPKKIARIILLDVQLMKN
jgi:hypothetical protein